jgi:hypothetical protein
MKTLDLSETDKAYPGALTTSKKLRTIWGCFGKGVFKSLVHHLLRYLRNAFTICWS